MKLLFGGLIAVILIALYVYSVGFAIMLVMSPDMTTEAFTAGFASTMTTVGGLVSALVIAELAVTKPGEAPVARVLSSANGAALSQNASRALTGVTTAYLLVWILTGLAAYIVGVLWFPEKLQHLTDLGQSWLGLAVASAYAYFGIKGP